MDINLTGHIASTLAENLKQINPVITIAASALGGAVTGAITFYAVKMTNENAERREKQNRDEARVKLEKENQWEIFRKLKGIQALLPQDYINKYSYSIEIVSHEAAARLHTEEANQLIQLEEAKRFIAYSIEHDRMFVKDRQELYELIGAIQLFFKNGEELIKNIDLIYSQLKPFESQFAKYKLNKELNDLIPSIRSDLTTWDRGFDRSKAGEYFAKLETWKIAKIDKVQTQASKIVFQQLDDLCNCLLAIIRAEQDKE